jgi:hypothetical protein
MHGVRMLTPKTQEAVRETPLRARSAGRVPAVSRSGGASLLSMHPTADHDAPSPATSEQTGYSFDRLLLGLSPSRPIQAKLALGTPGDGFEQEAERVADRVMRMPEPKVQRQCACGGACPSCQTQASPAQSELIQPRRVDSALAVPTTAGPSEVPTAVHDVMDAPGRPLDRGTLDFMEPRFGRSLDHLRIHDDASAHRAARAIDARAFTQGRDLYFASGQYDPASPAGRHLLAHEITHTMQQGAVGVLRRQSGGTGGGATCSAEICFAPIRMLYLDRVGAVHAIVNYTLPGGTAKHAEVQPQQHGAPADPGSGGSIGRTAGIHSHVVVGAGHRTGSTCTALTVTCAQATAIEAAARRYESLDVSYNPPPGPNSNSFGEWVLTEAGVSTASVTVPIGAWGWGYYVSNPGQRAAPERVARRARQTAATCTLAHAPARTFRAYIALLRSAETQLVACGITDVGERVHVLRGIYYGTPWSRDFDTSESSHVRNQAFNVYTGSSQPRNPLECMDCGTFLSLGESQDLVEGTRRLDVGHLIIGLDARRSVAARTVPQPVGQVTGLEASTWAGDLGGGAARLSVDRIAAPTTSALNYFRGSNYGGSINLEGDVAAYAVAAPASPGLIAAPALAITPGATLADTLEAFLIGNPAAGVAAGRDTRARGFLTGVGGTFDASGTLSNRASVVSYIARQTESFGCWYLVNYMRQHGGFDAARAESASYHMAGASQEIAEVFVAALERSLASPSTPIEARPPAPASTPRASSASCRIARTAGQAATGVGSAVDEARRRAGPLVDQAGQAVDDARRRAGQLVDDARRGLGF